MSEDQKVAKDDLTYMSSVSEAILEQTPKGAQVLLWAFFAVIIIAMR